MLDKKSFTSESRNLELVQRSAIEHSFFAKQCSSSGNHKLIACSFSAGIFIYSALDSNAPVTEEPVRRDFRLGSTVIYLFFYLWLFNRNWMMFAAHIQSNDGVLCDSQTHFFRFCVSSAVCRRSRWGVIATPNTNWYRQAKKQSFGVLPSRKT